MEEHKMANRDPKMEQQRATMTRRRRMAIMQGRVMPGGLMAAHGGGSMVGQTAGQQPPQQAQRMLVPQQPGNIAPNGLQDLLRTLRSPSSPQQQQQVLNILKSNPPLMAAFIKQRAAKYRLQQAQAAPPPAEQLDDVAAKSPQESRRLSIQRCIQSLVHACQCRNANCSLPSCQKTKRVVQHTKNCKRKTNGSCPVCKQLISYHAKHCQENKCPVPFCLNIRHKLRQRQLQERLQQAQMMRRRMAAMQGQVMQNSQHPPTA